MTRQEFIAAALARMLVQYKTAANLRAVISSLAGQSYDELAAIAAAMDAEVLDTATGEQLDGFGKILNVPRGLMDDTHYRAALILKIAENFSEGTTEDLISIFGQIMTATSVQAWDFPPASFGLQAQYPTVPDPVNARTTVEACKVAGVGIGFLSYTTNPPFAFLEDPDPDGLGFDDGSGTIGGYLAASF